MSDSTSYDNLIAGTQKSLVTRPATIASGTATFARGALLARVTATGKWTLAVHANLANYDDLGVATEDVDATAADVLTDAFVEGEFAEAKVAYQGADTANTWREDLTPHGIYLRKTVSVAGQ
jgi:hypothetical protein